MQFRSVILGAITCCALLCLNPGAGLAFMNLFSKTPPPPYECAFEKDFNPPLDLNSEAHKLYLQAREFEGSKPVLSQAERENVSLMYIQAMEQGHWKAKAHMVARYLDGIGVDRNSAIAARLAYELMRQGIPIGYYNFGLFTMKGWGTSKDEKEGMRLIHEAAALGSKDAQYRLGEYYIYKRFDDVRGLKYHVCATRQGHGDSANAVSVYMKIEENYPMAVEYLLRAAGMGYGPAFVSLEGIFRSPDKPDINLGFAQSAYITDYAYRGFDILHNNPRQRFPNIGKECPLPEHPILGNGRHLPSKLKEACGGMWPDEAYPELKDW